MNSKLETGLQIIKGLDVFNTFKSRGLSVQEFIRCLEYFELIQEIRGICKEANRSRIRLGCDCGCGGDSMLNEINEFKQWMIEIEVELGGSKQ